MKKQSRLCKLIENINRFLPISEASMSRIWQHFNSGKAFAMITAFRSENSEVVDKKNNIRSEKKNRLLNKEMKNTVREAGYGFFPVEGHYPEITASGREVDRTEDSIFIIDNKDNPDQFFDFICDLGAKYGQDSVFIKDIDGKCYLIYTRNVGRHSRGDRDFLGDQLFTNANSFSEDQKKIFSQLKGRKFNFGTPNEA